MAATDYSFQLDTSAISYYSCSNLEAPENLLLYGVKAWRRYSCLNCNTFLNITSFSTIQNYVNYQRERERERERESQN
jgi:hypothetical protein